MENYVYEKDYRKHPPRSRKNQTDRTATKRRYNECKAQEQYEALKRSYAEREPRLIANAWEILRLTENRCEQFAKRHDAYFKVALSVEDHDVSVMLCMPSICLDPDDMEFLSEMRRRCKRVVFLSQNGELCLLCNLRFFAGHDSPAMSAWKETYIQPRKNK